MSVVAFDTLKFAQTLRDKAHVPSEQAEGIAEAFADCPASSEPLELVFDGHIRASKSSARILSSFPPSRKEAISPRAHIARTCAALHCRAAAT